MRPFLRFILALMLLRATGIGQDEDTRSARAVSERAIVASATVESFRPIGEFRVWRFFSKQTTFGQLSSAVTGETEIDGEDALVFRESLRIDYSKIGADRQVVVSGETHVSDDGYFLGTSLEIGDDQTTERLELERHGTSLDGFFTRSGIQNDLTLPYGRGLSFWDVNLVDQLEIFLAMRDIEIGAGLDDSIFMPQSLLKSRIVGEVIRFMQKEIYKGKFDSVFVIRLTEPSSYQLYFTPDKRLVRFDMLDQDIRVYQDLVQRAPAGAATQTGAMPRSSVSARALLFKLPHYVAFVVLAGMAVLLISARGFRYGESYLALAGGALLYVLMPLALNPLLVTIAESWLRPAAAGGGSLYLRGAVPPVLFALIQVGLLTVGFKVVGGLLKLKEYRYVAAGAFLGAGFGLAEAVFVAGLRVTPLFDWALAERAGFILLQTASGALIGRACLGGSARLVRTFLIIAGINGVARYLPLLVQGRLVDVELVHLIILLWVLVYLLATLILLKRPVASRAGTAGTATEDG